MAGMMPSNSPYVYANNGPIAILDEDGNLPKPSIWLKDNFGTQLSPITAGALDGFVEGLSFVGAVDFISQMANPEFRSQMLDAFEKIGTDPMGFAQLIAEDYRQKAENILAWNEQGQYDAGYTGGELAASVVSGGGFFKIMKYAKKLKNPCGCFTENVLILTSEGLVRISEIEEGDEVWSYNDSTGVQELKPVTHTFKYERDTLYTIHIGALAIETTSDHPFYVNNDWVSVKNLIVGDSVNLFTGEPIAIDSILITPKEIRVYNFTVKDFHTYYVSDKGILVHNSGPCDLIAKGFKSTGHFKQFGTQLQAGFAKLGFKDTKLHMQGSSAKGVKYKNGKPFDSNSDFDVALTGEDIFKKAQELDLISVTKSKAIEVGSEAAKKLGINDLLVKMSKKYGRDVNVMIFKNTKEVKLKEPKSVKIPTKKDSY